MRVTSPAQITDDGAAWTPGVTFATPGDIVVAYTTQVGWWVRRGNWILAGFNILTSSFTYTTASGSLNVTGLPFTSRNTTGITSSGVISQIRGYTKANYTAVAAQLIAKTAVIRFMASGSGQTPAILAVADVPSAGTVNLVGQVEYPI